MFVSEVTTALEAISHDIRLPTDWLKALFVPKAKTHSSRAALQVDRLLRGIAHFWWKQHEDRCLPPL